MAPPVGAPSPGRHGKDERTSCLMEPVPVGVGGLGGTWRHGKPALPLSGDVGVHLLLVAPHGIRRRPESSIGTDFLGKRTSPSTAICPLYACTNSPPRSTIRLSGSVKFRWPAGFGNPSGLTFGACSGKAPSEHDSSPSLTASSPSVASAAAPPDCTARAASSRRSARARAIVRSRSFSACAAAERARSACSRSWAARASAPCPCRPPQGGYPRHRARDPPPGWDFRPEANGQGQRQGHRSLRELGGACGPCALCALRPTGS